MSVNLRKKKTGKFLCLFFIIGCLSPLAAESVEREGDEKQEIIEVEKIIDFTGELKVTLPGGEVRKLTAGDEIFEFPENTLVEVVSGIATATVRGNLLILKEEQTARIIKSLIFVQKIIKFTGKLKITLPGGEEIVIKSGEALPELPAETMIEIIQGDLTVISQGEQITLNPGEIAQLENDLEGETELEEIEIITPISPTW